MKTIKRILFTITVLVLFGSSALAIPTNATFHTSEPEPSPVLTPDNVNDWRLLYSLGTKRVYDYALNPTKPELVYSNEDGVFFYDFINKTSTPFTEYLPRPADPRWKSYSVAFSPNGRYLAIGESRILIYDLFNNNNRIKSIVHPLYEYRIRSLEFSPDGKHLLISSDGGTASCDGPGLFYSLVDLMFDYEPDSTKTSPYEERTYPQTPYEIVYERSLCFQVLSASHMFSDDGNLVLVGLHDSNSGWKYEAVSIDINTGQELARYTINQDKSGTYIFSVSQDLNYIVEISYIYPSSPSLVELKDFKTGRLIQTFPDRIYHLNQTDYILSSKSSSPETPSEFKILDRDLEEVCTFKTQPSIALDMHRSSIKITNEKITTYTFDRQSLGVWDLSTCELLWELPLLNFSSAKEPISTSGEVFYNNAGEYIDAINLKTGERNFRLSPSKGNYFSSYYYDRFVQEDSTKNELYIKTGERTIDVFDSLSGKQLRTLTITSNREEINELFITPDFENVVYRSDSSVYLYYWNIKSQKDIRLTSILPGSLFQFSSDFKKIAFWSSYQIKICDFSNTLENCIHVYPPNEYRPQLFSDDFSTLLLRPDRYRNDISNDESGSELKLLDVQIKSFLKLESMPKLYPEINAYFHYYDDFAFSPTEDILVALYKYSDNYELHVWNTKTGAALANITFHERAEKLWFTPDGSKIVVLASGVLYIIGIPE